jgi:hypothetical protein
VKLVGVAGSLGRKGAKFGLRTTEAGMWHVTCVFVVREPLHSLSEKELSGNNDSEQTNALRSHLAGPFTSWTTSPADRPFFKDAVLLEDAALEGPPSW